jgi:tetratricopeptide (TPR) repeat protein
MPTTWFRPALLLVIAVTVLMSGTPVLANDPHTLNDYAVDLINKGEYEKALDSLQRAYSNNVLDVGMRRNLAEANAYVGKKLFDEGRFEEAARYFDNAGELFPEVSRYALLRGIALYFAKRYETASYELERARKLGGDSVELLYFLGRIRYDSDDLAGALEFWDKALAIDPKNKSVLELADKARREASVETGMGKGYSSRFNISYDADLTSDLATSILDTLESAYNKVGADFSHFPQARIPVILYTKKDYRTVTAGPDWSGGLYDGKIRLPIGGASTLSDILRSVLFHEYTHVVVRELTHGNCPTWLNEGLAEVQGRREFNMPLQELPKALKGGNILPFASLEGAFTSLGGAQARLAYEESYSIVNFMLSTYGWFNVREILVNLGKGMTVASAVAGGLADFGVDYTRLELEWREYLRREVGR